MAADGNLAVLALTLGLLSAQTALAAQGAQPAVSTEAPPPVVFSEADRLRGSYGPYRANNDLLYYHLDVRVDPEKQFLSGRNSIRFKMLKDGKRIQLDLVPAFQSGKILLDRSGAASQALHYERAAGRTVYVDFPETLLKGRIYTIEFYYSGHPVEMGRFGGFVFRKDPVGRPLVNTACEEEGASVWWPNKDQWRDEVKSMDISVEAPSDLVEVSGGRFQGKEDLHDGYTRWNWKVQYPINNYDVSLNIGKYVHFDDRYGDLTLDYYVFPEDLAKARPGYGFIGEEGGSRPGDDKTHTWIVDPLDGTTNFLHGIAQFAISIALKREDLIIAGVIYNPANEELYIAERGKGAFLNDQRIRVAGRRKLGECVIACGLPHIGRGDHELSRREMAEIQNKVAGLRRFGAASLDMAFIAAGRLDGYWERNLQAWDMAAGQIIVREAGGIVSGFEGNDDALTSGNVICGNEYVHAELLKILQPLGK